MARCQIHLQRCGRSRSVSPHGFVRSARSRQSSRRQRCAGCGDQRGGALGGRALRRRTGSNCASTRVSTLAKQVGSSPSRREPAPQARCAGQAWSGRLGRHRRGGIQAHDRSDQPGRRLRQCEDRGRGEVRRPARCARRRPRRGAARGAAGTEGRGVERAPQGIGRRHVGAGARVRLIERGAAANDVGAACPDHLVHTERVPMWVRFDPASEDAATLRERVRDVASRYRADYAAYVDDYADETTVPGDPDARVGTDPARWPRWCRDHDEERIAVARLDHRAIEVMAGAHALGGFTSLDCRREFRG